MRVGDEVWYTNIPHLGLIDEDGDGIAERRADPQRFRGPVRGCTDTTCTASCRARTAGSTGRSAIVATTSRPRTDACWRIRDRASSDASGTDRI